MCLKNILIVLTISRLSACRPIHITFIFLPFTCSAPFDGSSCAQVACSAGLSLLHEYFRARNSAGSAAWSSAGLSGRSPLNQTQAPPLMTSMAAWFEEALFFRTVMSLPFPTDGLRNGPGFSYRLHPQPIGSNPNVPCQFKLA